VTAAGDIPDEALMEALAAGAPSALESLMRRYQQDLFRFCLHYLKDAERARDLTQETFIRVYTASDRFDQSRKFRPWVLCIARNLCLNELKRRKTVPMESLEDHARRGDSSEVFRSTEYVPDERAMSDERLELLERALDSLAEDAREIVVLRFFQRMSAREIADIVGSTEGAVRTRLHRILMSLRDSYQACRKDL
jgi:RNA polymerase sigma-70 factor (ECF subfamily)